MTAALKRDIILLVAANVTNETGEDSLQIFGWQYWVSYGQIMSNCLYLYKNLYRVS